MVRATVAAPNEFSLALWAAIRRLKQHHRRRSSAAVFCCAWMSHRCSAQIVASDLANILASSLRYDLFLPVRTIDARSV
jgi:hypothetical protein